MALLNMASLPSSANYTIGFQQSGNEYQRQLILTALHASDPRVRETARLSLQPIFYKVQPEEERPFPKYSYETTTVTCSNGDCTRITADGKPMTIKRTPFGL